MPASFHLLHDFMTNKGNFIKKKNEVFYQPVTDRIMSAPFCKKHTCSQMPEIKNIYIRPQFHQKSNMTPHVRIANARASDREPSTVFSQKQPQPYLQLKKKIYFFCNPCIHRALQACCHAEGCNTASKLGMYVLYSAWWPYNVSTFFNTKLKWKVAN